MREWCFKERKRKEVGSRECLIINALNEHVFDLDEKLDDIKNEVFKKKYATLINNLIEKVIKNFSSNDFSLSVLKYNFD